MRTFLECDTVVRLMEITPEIATEWLAHQSQNRKINKNTVASYVRSIRNGEWQVNGETIKINDAGKLIDGQHRCAAVVASEKPILAFVAFDVPSNSFTTIDTGRKRRGGDVLSIMGESHASLLSAALAWVWRYDQGVKKVWAKVVPSHQQIIDTLSHHPEIRESVRAHYHTKGLMSPSIAVALHYLFSKKDASKADMFFAKLGSGEMIGKYDPFTSGIYWLRQRLQNDKQNRAKMYPPEIFFLGVKAWNGIRSETLVKVLKISSNDRLPSIL